MPAVLAQTVSAANAPEFDVPRNHDGPLPSSARQRSAALFHPFAASESSRFQTPRSYLDSRNGGDENALHLRAATQADDSNHLLHHLRNQVYTTATLAPLTRSQVETEPTPHDTDPHPREATSLDTVAVGGSRSTLDHNGDTVDDSVGLDNAINTLSCRTPELHPDPCQFVKDNCQSDGLIDYLPLYYCRWPNQPAIFYVVAVILLVIYFYVLYHISDMYLTSALQQLSNYLNMSNEVAGLTLLSFGNSAPDFFTALAGVSSDGIELVLGSTLSGGVFVITFVLGAVIIAADTYYRQNIAPQQSSSMSPKSQSSQPIEEANVHTPWIYTLFSQGALHRVKRRLRVLTRPLRQGTEIERRQIQQSHLFRTTCAYSPTMPNFTQLAHASNPHALDDKQPSLYGQHLAVKSNNALDDAGLPLPSVATAEPFRGYPVPPFHWLRNTMVYGAAVIVLTYSLANNRFNLYETVILFGGYILFLASYFVHYLVKRYWRSRTKQKLAMANAAMSKLEPPLTPTTDPESMAPHHPNDHSHHQSHPLSPKPATLASAHTLSNTPMTMTDQQLAYSRSYLENQIMPLIDFSTSLRYLVADYATVVTDLWPKWSRFTTNTVSSVLQMLKFPIHLVIRLTIPPVMSTVGELEMPEVPESDVSDTESGDEVDHHGDRDDTGSSIGHPGSNGRSPTFHPADHGLPSDAASAGVLDDAQRRRISTWCNYHYYQTRFSSSPNLHTTHPVSKPSWLASAQSLLQSKNLNLMAAASPPSTAPTAQGSDGANPCTSEAHVGKRVMASRVIPKIYIDDYTLEVPTRTEWVDSGSDASRTTHTSSQSSALSSYFSDSVSTDDYTDETDSDSISRHCLSGQWPPATDRPASFASDISNFRIESPVVDFGPDDAGDSAITMGSSGANVNTLSTQGVPVPRIICTPFHNSDSPEISMQDTPKSNPQRFSTSSASSIGSTSFYSLPSADDADAMHWPSSPLPRQRNPPSHSAFSLQRRSSMIDPLGTLESAMIPCPAKVGQAVLHQAPSPPVHQAIRLSRHYSSPAISPPQAAPRISLEEEDVNSGTGHTNELTILTQGLGSHASDGPSTAKSQVSTDAAHHRAHRTHRPLAKKQWRPSKGMVDFINHLTHLTSSDLRRYRLLLILTAFTAPYFVLFVLEVENAPLFPGSPIQVYELLAILCAAYTIFLAMSTWQIIAVARVYCQLFVSFDFKRRTWGTFAIAPALLDYFNLTSVSTSDPDSTKEAATATATPPGFFPLTIPTTASTGARGALDDEKLATAMPTAATGSLAPHTFRRPISTASIASTHSAASQPAHPAPVVPYESDIIRFLKFLHRRQPSLPPPASSAATLTPAPVALGDDGEDHDGKRNTGVAYTNERFILTQQGDLLPSTQTKSKLWHLYLVELILSVVSFIVCVIWIYATANELVALVQTVGILLGISDRILGATILAWGNSLGDLFADIAMARAGYFYVALTAVFTAPILNTMLNLGVNFFIGCVRSGTGYLQFPTFSSPMIFCTVFLMFMTFVVGGAVVPFLLKFRLPRFYGYILYGLFAIFLVGLLTLEFLLER
ncbi:Mitochondrial sodium/calcium exchanger protein [Dimargaris xerosporica]|nr:Mitochondrial sodium/calcium exchanger protein [Dimargaris xerosporica]